VRRPAVVRADGEEPCATVAPDGASAYDADVRVAASVLPGLGHLNPMVPLLRALAERGHDVEVVVPPPFVPFVERGGLRAVGVGPSWTEATIDEVHPDFLRLDGAGQLVVWTEFATRFEPHLRRHVDTTRPDVIVHDHFELAAWLVGEQLRIPTVPYAMTVRGLDPLLVALCGAQDAVDAMCVAAGLPPDAGEGRGGRWLYLDALAPSLTAALLPAPPTVHHVRHAADDHTGEADGLPAWILERDRERPLVYVTLGTVFNRSPRVLQQLVDGAGRVDADFLLTIGGNGTAPPRLPPNVTVERYVPQGDLYEHLAAVVCHGGFGTTFGAISHRLPVACAPIAADQSVNAALIDGVGAGCNLATTIPEGAMFPVLREGEPSAEAVAAAVERLLHEPDLRTRAGALAEEMDSGASPAEAAALIEQLVETGRPVLTSP
jgi:UDP:flavonoid glycosyltransferase YjiC (YdhE family)